jgi:hypothetical protein
MEIRLQSRQTGITTWLISEAVQHAKEHQKSINYLLYPSRMQRDSSWNRQKKKMVALGGREFGNMTVLFDNGSAIVFITTSFILPEKRMLGYEKQFIFVDNFEFFYPTSVCIGSMRGSSFSNSDDLFIGGTEEGGGTFRIVVDYKEFCKTHNLNEYLREFDNIHDFIVETDFLKNDVVMSYCPCECEFCNECNLKNYGCLRLGKFFAVRRKCPLYSEMMVHLLNNGVDNELEKELEWNPSVK